MGIFYSRDISIKIPFIFPDYKQGEKSDKVFIKKIIYNLLLKTVEELLLNSKLENLSYENYTLAIKLILLSFLNNKAKNKLINNIISKINIPLESLNFIEEKNPLLLNEKQKFTLLANINNSACLWKNSFNFYISAQEYKYALDACINYAVEEIKKNKENTDFQEIFLRLEQIKRNMPSLPSLFVDIYQSFFLFFEYLNDKKNQNFKINDNDIIALLEDFSSKEKYLCNDLIDDNTRGIIIDLLYKLLIKINKGKISTGNSELIAEKYVKTNTELIMMQKALWDNIKYKNNIFQNDKNN